MSNSADTGGGNGGPERKGGIGCWGMIAIAAVIIGAIVLLYLMLV